MRGICSPAGRLFHVRKTLSGVLIAIAAAAGGALVATWATPLSGQAPAAYRAPRAADGAREEKREPGEVARTGSGDQVLSPGRAARQLHAISLPGSPEPERDLLRVRIRGRDAQHLLEGSWAGAR